MTRWIAELPLVIFSLGRCGGSLFVVMLIFALACSERTTMAAAGGFDPYQNNGGLVAAVAGRDYVAIACDTRLMHGYEILSREHVSSRLWSPLRLDPELRKRRSSVSDKVIDDEEQLSFPETGNRNHPRYLTTSDGSVRFYPGVNVTDGDDAATSSLFSVATLRTRQSPVWIASSGCNADCEHLKRVMRSRLRAATYFHSDSLDETDSSSTVSVASAMSVATLLSQVLYSRRGFPFYAFCVVAGLSPSSSADGTREVGQVFVYDAIGSHEQVSVATAGMGRELLQPILDRMLQSKSEPTSSGTSLSSPLSSSSSSSPPSFDAPESDASSTSSSGFDRTSTPLGSWGWQQQRKYPTQVSCTSQETVNILRRAYEAVSEREIGVGDQLIVCVVRRVRDEEGDSEGLFESRVITFPLKKH
jgi:20S proteasome subunit beta 6